MRTEAWRQLLRHYRAIAVLRTPDFEQGIATAKAAAAGGMALIEITWNSERPATLIRQLRQELPHCTVGAGTLLTVSQLQEAMAAGAQFCFTPHFNEELLAIARANQIPLVPGALSPTEIVTAWQAGASCVKVFPIQAVGGVSYLQHLQAPLGEIPLIPTGGVTVENAPQFIAAGAIAVGLSGSLFPASLVAAGDWQGITQLARTLQQQLREFKN
jgi:2-dehydro-3-deoxyphosphogluconate aldolase/(4S)-4-hydroxy-2-oxoglutarate aldolase